MQQQAKRLQTKSFYEFDEFRIDPVNRLLFRNGESIPLTAKVFDTLLVFVENSGRLLEKDELMQRVWQESFVEEGNLTRNVSRLRSALGEGPKAHQYIVTIPGYGYKFVAQVRIVQEAAPQIVIQEQIDSTTIIEEECHLFNEETANRTLPEVQQTGAATSYFQRNRLTILITAVAACIILVLIGFAVVFQK